ncbi:family 78 glycoside hydrolase catalytic domain [Sphingobium sp. OAS761]|uniref:family 78 glycoside hydrolase catalytic domain n=1 Tax=Sphingobium sp. OAS761 TaxID=2817901 RepID=UPI00209C9923|nr:family 78 glycoside hydrolase catalytic domain [Sphingobium sp. OAS761]
MRMRRRDVMKASAVAITSMAANGRLAAAEAAGFSIVDLQVCGVSAPLALGNRQPRLSWKLMSGDGDFMQGAYRIMVARSQEDLAAGRNLVWDSGRVESASTFDIPFGGPAAPSRARFWWSVEAWDAQGKRSARSRPAMWETGLFDTADWSAQWLASEDMEAALDRQAGLHWIDGTDRIPADGTRFYRTALTAARGESGVLLLSCPGLKAVWLNGKEVQTDDADPVRWTTMATYRLPLRPGRNVIGVSQGRYVSYNMPGSLLAAIIRITDARGNSRRLTSAAGWKASATAPDGWAAPGFDDSAWAATVAAKRKPVGEPWPAYPAMHLRRGFDAAKPVQSARLYATALGCYEPWLNGEKIGDRRMAPESTDTSKRILYQAYDVTGLVKPGRNMLGLWVGDGWYGSEFSEGARFVFGPAPCRVLAQLELTYADGSTEVIGTGDGWTTAPSAILSSEIYDGEVYDARRERSGWAQPDTSEEGWRAAARAAAPDIPVEPQVAPPIRVTRTIAPVAITQPRPDVHVVDFGQNFAGWARLRTQGAAGTKVEMRFAEILLPSGEVDQSNLRTAFARDTYILKGEGEEVWEPRFTYHGFRYVELHGLPHAPTQETLTGLVGHNDLPVTGAFRVGDPVIAKFWRNSTWSQRSNFFGLPTDCPQRDERLGWMGDAAVFWPAAAYNMDVDAYTRRFMQDVRYGQTKAGGFPDVIPPFMPNSQSSSPGWADAGVILPHTAWMHYGDTGIIAENWEAMDRYMAYILERNPAHLWKKSRGSDYADWLAVDAKQPGDATTPKDLIGTAFWAADARMMADMAAAIGKTADADRYRALFGAIRDAFLKEYVQPDGQIGNGSQTSYILPIRFDLLPAQLRMEAGRRLAANIAARGGKLSTGFLGTPHILDALADTGQQETAVALLLQRSYPSWGYMVEKGATTMWERWNSDGEDRTMNSFNHYAFGAITDFLFRRVAGIAPIDPGFRRVRVAPVFDRRIGQGGADYASIAGLIKTDWHYEGDQLILSVDLPPNVQGEVVLPGARRQIRMNRRPVAASRRVTEEKGVTRIVVGSGQYQFTVAV